MSQNIPDDVRQFIFEHVDSVAQLEILFLLRNRPGHWLTAEDIGKELRTNSEAVTHRLVGLKALGLLSENANNQFIYQPKDVELAELIGRLAEVYRVRQHKVLELIFSSVKRARQFADAFTIVRNPPPDEDENG